MTYAILLLIHTVASIGVGYWLYTQFAVDRQQARVWLWLGILFSFFLPVYGLVGILFIYIAVRHHRYAPATKASHDDHLRKDRLSAAASNATIMRVDWEEEKLVQPLVDALKGADVDLRKGAVDALAAKNDPEAIRMLANSLENTMLEVRYFAVEALSEISKDFGDRIIEAQQEAEANPQSYEAIAALGGCYYDYAISDVEDKTLSEYYLRQAHNEYHKAVQLAGNDVALLARFAEVLMRLDKFQEALDAYHSAASRDPRNLKAMIGIADAYFQMGKIQEVRRIVRQMKTSFGNLPDDAQQAASIWS